MDRKEGLLQALSSFFFPSSSHKLVELYRHPCFCLHHHFRCSSLETLMQILYHLSCSGFLGDIAVVSFLHDPTEALRWKHRAGTSKCWGLLY